MQVFGGGDAVSSFIREFRSSDSYMYQAGGSPTGSSAFQVAVSQGISSETPRQDLIHRPLTQIRSTAPTR
jgi:hypothetical protein